MGGEQLLSNNVPDLIGSNGSFNYYNYATVQGDLLKNAKASGDSLQLQAAQAVQSYNPFNKNIHVIRPEAEALGIVGGDNKLDAYVGFSETANWSFTPGSVDGSQDDFFAAAVHEITEEMGRTAFGGTVNILGLSSQKIYTVLDMFRYFAGGEANAYSQINGPPVTFLSVDGKDPYGTGQYNNVSQSSNALGVPDSDLSDWASSSDYTPGSYPPPASTRTDGDPVPNDAFGAQSGGMAPLSEEDFAEMKVLGWDVAVVVSADTFTVSAGQTVSGEYVLDGGTMEVAAGGTATSAYYTNATAFDDLFPASGSAVSNGAGYGEVYGLDLHSLVAAGGWQQIGAGGVASDTEILPLGEQEVQSGGSAVSARVVSGALEQIDSGGVATDSLVLSGALQDMGGSAVSATISGQQIVGVGGSALFTTVASGASETVASSGTASATMVSDGGLETVSATAVAFASIVMGGGTLIDYGVVKQTTLDAVGLMTVQPGGTASGTYVAGGASEQVLGDDVAANVFGNGNNAYQAVSGGGTSENAGVYLDGVQIVYGGGIALDTQVYAGGVQHLLKFSSATGTVIHKSGSETLYGHDLDAVISGLGAQIVGSLGTATDAFVLQGGVQVVQSGGVASATAVQGGRQVVSFGGIASADVIHAGGSQSLLGSAHATDVANGGTETVSAGGVATATSVLSGGKLIVLRGGLASGAAVSSGGDETVSGVDRGATVRAGGTLTVAAGGNASLTIVDGGAELVAAGGTATDARVLDGGVETVYGDDLGTAIGQGGQQIVFGEVMLTKVLVDGTQTIFAGSVRDASVIGTGAQQVVAAGSSVSATISNGGTETVGQDGVASATTIAGGGLVNDGEPAVLGGRIISALVEKGGLLFVETDGNATSTRIDGGSEAVSGGATDTSAVISSGGMTVENGGTSSDAVIMAGGDVYAENGGVVQAPTIDGGHLELDGGGVAGNPGLVTFTGPPGTLRVDVAPGSEPYAADIVGFGSQDVLDGAYVSFSSTTTLQVIPNGDLHDTAVILGDGSNELAVLLEGLYSSASFMVQTDSFGGTDIVGTGLAETPAYGGTVAHDAAIVVLSPPGADMRQATLMTHDLW